MIIEQLKKYNSLITDSPLTSNIKYLWGVGVIRNILKGLIIIALIYGRYKTYDLFNVNIFIDMSTLCIILGIIKEINWKKILINILKSNIIIILVILWCLIFKEYKYIGIINMLKFVLIIVILNFIIQLNEWHKVLKIRGKGIYLLFNYIKIPFDIKLAFILMAIWLLYTFFTYGRENYVIYLGSNLFILEAIIIIYIWAFLENLSQLILNTKKIWLNYEKFLLGLHIINMIIMFSLIKIIGINDSGILIERFIIISDQIMSFLEGLWSNLGFKKVFCMDSGNEKEIKGPSDSKNIRPNKDPLSRISDIITIVDKAKEIADYIEESSKDTLSEAPSPTDSLSGGYKNVHDHEGKK